jgi:hypothetical protein
MLSAQLGDPKGYAVWIYRDFPILQRAHNLSIFMASATTQKGHLERWPLTLYFPCNSPVYQLLDAAGAISSFTTDTTPLTIPVISSTAGTTCATTIIAQNPKNTHTKIPLVSSLNPFAANAVAGAMVPTIVVISALMTSSYFNLLLNLIAYVFVTALPVPTVVEYFV